jgi:hypothetical protein
MIKISSISVSLLLSSIAAIASAASILPDNTGFGALPGATFGSPTSSIPNTAVAQETFGGVTLGLSATQRYSSPAVTNNGLGTFYAAAGAFVSEPGQLANPSDPYAKWNFNWAILGAPLDILKYSYRLYYDFNSLVGNDISTHEYGPPTALQGSENLGANYLALNPNPPISTFSSFDPNALGEYTFKLAAYTSTGIPLTNSFNAYATEVFSTSMVVSVVPEPGEWAMMLAGLGVVSAIARRRRNK